MLDVARHHLQAALLRRTAEMTHVSNRNFIHASLREIHFSHRCAVALDVHAIQRGAAQ